LTGSGYLLALEGGGTRSQAALLDLDGQLIQAADGGDVNTNFTSQEQALYHVRGVVRSVLEAAGAAGAAVGIFVSALVGPQFGAETFGGLCPNARFLYYREREVIFARAGIYRPHGVGLVAATGATAFGVRADDGRETFFGGWGSLLGDEGSAYAMGLLGMRAAARAFEGRLDCPTRLVDALCQRLQLDPAQFRAELVRLAYHKPLSRADVAGLAGLVTGLAGEGDPLAARICEKVARDLAGLGLHAARSLFDPGEVFDFVAAGGLLNAGERVTGPLRQGLARAFPRAVLTVGDQPPAAALGRLAIHHLKQEDAC
jgi:N-acetylglucosamine kinase-like BadF-type ATPase